ncbi:LPXTG cell wall anchor domain-containing protein [Massilistercora timonensis]|uniref:LPXTG cell wall anchor domain-containing protein n=1 Tax=Massilistercora timonensis TaxID=2086584 RepID=UPI00320A9CCB
MLRKKSLLALLLSLCMVVGILPATVFAAGAGMPQNIRWAESPKSMVQWDAPSGGGQYQYELRLKLGETIIDGPDLTVQRYHLFNGSLMTEARENYTVEIRARSCIIVGEFPNEYVTSPGEWGDWATLEGSGGGEGPTPPHEHSFGGWKNNGTQHWKECSCGEKSEESPHNFGEWELIYYDVNTKYDVCERQCLTCGYEQIDRYREHQHYYTDDWRSGSTTHWKVCYYCKEVNQDTVADHTFGDWTITKEPTTTETGSRERTCSTCNYKDRETLPVHEHSHNNKWEKDDAQHWRLCSCGEKFDIADHSFDNWTITKEPTTTETGSRERDCTVCDYVQTETIPMLEHEHSYGDWQKDKTQHWKECSCGEKTEVGNHTFDNWTITKEPTTTETGSRERDCTVCDYVQTETIPMLEHEHSYGDWQKDETQHWKECRCGEKTEVGNHTFDNWTITKEPTTTETGSRERDCTVCDYVQTETIPMLEHEHSYGDWQSNDTQHWKECRCGEKIEVGDHTYGEWKITKEPTTTEAGSRERTCSICKYTQTETLPVHTHDVHDEAWKYDETQHWQECSCGEKLNVANHTYGDWKVTKEATETEAGSKERGCTVCKYVQTEAIPEIGHEHGIHDETWKYDETDHWQECSCGEKLNVANHTYGDWKVTKEATETEEGSRERGCAVCEYVQTEAIPAAGTGEPTDSTDPTDSSDSQGQQDPSGDTGSPQTGDSSDMALWIGLMLASCGGVLGMLFYRRKKAAAGK